MQEKSAGTVRSVVASLQFPADGAAGGSLWSNTDSSLIAQLLVSVEAAIHNARDLPEPASIAREGFACQRNPLDNPAWDDGDWLRDTYIPSCVALVQRLTGRRTVMPFARGIALFRTAGSPQPGAAALPARFVHLDQTIASAERLVIEAMGADWRERFASGEIYNVWRPLTLPPQDKPLALCAQHSVRREALFQAGVVVGSVYSEIPYVSTVPTADMRWYYYPDMDLDETIVFKGIDTDEQHPFGCLHTAFDLPGTSPGVPPRRSIETRVLVMVER